MDDLDYLDDEDYSEYRYEPSPAEEQMMIERELLAAQFNAGRFWYV